MNVYNFEDVTNYNYHWLSGDSIRSIKRDLYFSLSTRYYCAAGCKVCYIANNLDTMKPNVNKFFPEVTDKMEELWEDVFHYFEYLRTDDDMYYLKKEHPGHFDWFKRNAHRFEYGITDNAIFRYLKVMDEIPFAGMGSVSISSFFASRVQPDKLFYALDKLYDERHIQQLKCIDTHGLDVLRPYVEWGQKKGIETLFHYDFNKERDLIESNLVEDQVTWIDTDGDGTMQVYGDEAIGLYYDRFYLSNELSSNINEEAYSYLTDSFDPEEFLVDLARGKQKLYNVWKDRTLNKKFRDYFKTTLEYEFHKGYNFIPGDMMPAYSLYCQRLIERGWIKSKHGLYKPADNLVPIVTKVA